MEHALKRTIFFLSLLVLLSFLAVRANEEPLSKAAESHATGTALLQKGDFKGALGAFTKAAKAEPDNAAYSDQVRVLRRVMTLRKYVAENDLSPKWKKVALSLHVYYLRNKVYGEALSLGKMVHIRLQNAESASILAQTLLELDKNAEAVSMLRALDKKERTSQTQVCLGIALARQGKADEAKKIASNWPRPADADAGLLINYARFNVLLGKHPAALETLIACLEQASLKQQGRIRDLVEECKDFKPLMAHADFAKVMQTKSKVETSSCSEGTDCGSCPKRTAGGG